MTAFDFGLIGLVFISAIFGLVRGLTREFLGLVSWSSAIILAYITMPFAKQFAREYISNPMLADATTVFVTFLIFLIILSLASHLLSNIVRNSVLGGLDKTLGFAFGIVRGLVLIFVLELLINIFLPRQDYPQSLRHSRFFTFVMHGANTVYSLLPKSIKITINDQRGKRKDILGKPQAIIIPQSGGRITAIPKLVKQGQKTIKSSEQRASDLSNLRPRSNKKDQKKTTKAKNYSKTQKNSLERLLEQATDD